MEINHKERGITVIAASMKGGKIGSILALPTTMATIPTSSVALALERRSSSFVSTMKDFMSSKTRSAYGRNACSEADATEPIADCRKKIESSRMSLMLSNSNHLQYNYIKIVFLPCMFPVTFADWFAMQQIVFPLKNQEMEEFLHPCSHKTQLMRSMISPEKK